MSEKNEIADGPKKKRGPRRDVVERWTLETRPALEEIRRLVQAAGISQRKVEKRAGFSKGYLSQLLVRNLDLKMWHVLAILDALEHNPAEFFSQLYPGTRFPALERFQSTSKPLSEEMSELLGRLYKHGVASLTELRDRLARCERAVSKLEDMGLLDEPRVGRREEES